MSFLMNLLKLLSLIDPIVVLIDIPINISLTSNDISRFQFSITFIQFTTLYYLSFIHKTFSVLC